MAKTNNANFSFLAPDIDFYHNKGATKVMYKSKAINLTLFWKLMLSRLLIKAVAKTYLEQTKNRDLFIFSFNV